MKRKNPFAGKNSDTERMDNAVQAIMDLEKKLGKEEFNKLLKDAIFNLGTGGSQEENHDDEPVLDFEPVTTAEWRETHPANLTCASDSYYAELATDLSDLLSEFSLPPSVPEGLVRELGRVLAAYLEDVVSGTRVFAAMRRVCMQRYGYKLPFYDCRHQDYMDDHINDEDIKFLIWKTVSQLGKEQNITYSPLAAGWALMADKVFDELNSRYEEAPESGRVADWLRRSFRNEDYIDIREIASWLVFRNPMTYVPGLLNAIEEGVEQSYLDDSFDPEQINAVSYGIMACQSWQRSMSAMGCPSKTLVAAIASELGHDVLARDIEEIEVLPKQIYAIEKEKKTRKIIFETFRHERLEVERTSLARGFRPDEIGYAECNLIKYKGKYCLNGILAGNPDFRTRWETQLTLLTYEQQLKQSEKWISLMDGRQVLCVANLKPIFKKLGFPEDWWTGDPDTKNFVVLLSKEIGVAILPDMGYAFGIPGNRFFRKRAASKDSFSDMVFNNSIPYDVALYIQRHNLLPEACIAASQGKEAGLRIVQDYLAFWFGFYCELPAYGVVQKMESEENTD